MGGAQVLVSLRTEFSEYLPAFSIATQQVADRQELSQSFNWSRRRNRSTKRKDVRQVHSDHRQLPAGPAGTPPPGWRRLEDRGRWELEVGGQRDQGHPGVGRGEEGGGRVGGGCEGGCQPQVLQLRSPRHGGSHPTRRPLRLLWREEGESVPFEPLQHLRLHHPPPPDRRHRVINVDDANINFIKEKISNEAAKIDIEDPEKLAPGSKFVQNLFFGVSAGLSAIILFFTITLCCRARREERVQGYVEAIQA